MRSLTKTRRTKKHDRATFEKLESRQLYSVVMVNPGNFQGAINASQPGDTVTFTAGNYALNGSLALPSNRTYVGNGAAFTGDGSGNQNVSFANTSGVDFSGFVLNGCQAVLDGANGLDFHANKVENMNGDAVRGAGFSNCKINNNTFTQITGGGVAAYPGDGNQFDNNTFDYVWEPIHIVPFPSCSNTDVSGNTITHATRIGIELQNAMSDLTVKNNWISDFLPYINTSNGIDSHMGISCATVGGSNINISDNVIIQSGPDSSMDHWAKSGIELAGNSNLTVSGNYVWGWGTALLYGDGQGTTINSSNNIYICDSEEAGDGGAPAGGYGTVTNTGDRYYTMSDPSAPGFPAAPANVVTTGSSTSSSAPAATSSVATPTNLSATSPSSSEIDLSWKDNTNGAGSYVLQRRATNGSAGFQTVATLASGTTSYKDIGLNAQWQYTYQLTSVVSGVSSEAATVEAQVQAAAAPIVSAPVVTTPVVSTPVVATPVVTAPVTASTVVAPTNVAVSTAGPGQITVTWAAGKGVPTVYIYPTRGVGGAAAAIDLGQLAAGATSATISGINNTWEVIAEVSFTVGGVESAQTAAPNIQVTNSTIAATAAFTPTLAAAVAPPSTTTTTAAAPTTTTTTAAPPSTTTAPVTASTVATPTNVAVSTAGPGQITVTWAAGKGVPTIYIYPTRGVGGAAAAIDLGQLAAGATSATIGGINSTWEVTAEVSFTVGGVESAQTAAPNIQVTNSTIAATAAFAPALINSATASQTTATTTTNVVTAPAAPTVLLAASPSSSEVDLSWVDNSGGTATYVMERRATHGPSGFEIIATLPTGATSYTDTNVNPQWEYEYSLIAVSSGASSAAATVHVQVQPELSSAIATAA